MKNRRNQGGGYTNPYTKLKMPRRGSELVKFLREALCKNWYSNLMWVNQPEQIFCLKCIHGGNKEWSENGCKIYEDWKNKKKRRQTNKNKYSEGRQRLLAAINKCKLIKKFKKESKVSIKYFQFIGGSNTDSETASSEGTSDRETSPEPGETGMDGMEDNIETIPNDCETMSSAATDFKLPPEILADLMGSTDINMPISTESDINPNFLTDCKENVTYQDLSLQPASSPGLSSEVDILKINLFPDGSMPNKEEEIKICSMENCSVENLDSFTQHFAGDTVENNYVASGSEVHPLDSVVDVPEAAALPPVKLFRMGDYLIGITKVPK